MINLKDSPYREIYSQCWQFFKQALPVQDNDRYWGEILTEGEKVVKKYENTQQSQFARDQIFAVVNELERIRKAGSFDSLKRSGTEKTKV